MLIKQLLVTHDMTILLHSSRLKSVHLHELLLFRFSFLKTLDCVPSYAVTHWLPTLTEYGEWIQPRIVSEYLFQIIGRVDVIVAFEWQAFLFQIFNGCLVFPG